MILSATGIHFRCDFAHSEKEYIPPEPGSEGFSLDAVKEYIHTYVRYCARHPEHARLMMQEANRDSARLSGWRRSSFVRGMTKQSCRSGM